MSTAQPLIVEKIINAPAHLVWEAITSKEHMKQWYFDIAEFKAEEGFEFQFYGQGHKGEQYLHLCRITELIPGKKLSYSWKYDNYDGNSFVSFELFEEDGKTRVKLTHEGLESFPASNPDFAKSSFTEGWTWLIQKSLPGFLEKHD